MKQKETKGKNKEKKKAEEQNRAKENHMSETNTVLSSNGGNNFDLTWRHGPSTTQVNISTHLFPYVDTTGHDGVNSQLVNTRIVFAPNGRFKQSFGTAVSSRVHSNFPMEIKVTDYLNLHGKRYDMLLRRNYIEKQLIT